MAERQKTILFYLNTLSIGGAQRVFVELAERFAQNGYRSVFVTSFKLPANAEYSLSSAVEHISMEPEPLRRSRLRRNMSRILALRQLCVRYGADILVSGMREPNFRAVLASAGLPVKLLVSVCSASEKEYSGKLGWIVGKLLMPSADGCVFQTADEKRWFPMRLQKKSRIIMNQVNESFFDVRYSGPRRDIVTVGRLSEPKNQALLIRAFARIADQTPENLLLYGEGELHDALQSLIDTLSLHERVKLMGQTSDVAQAIKSAKLFVLSSDWEGVPNALLEAMALGLPCVCTDCLGGGPAEIIRNGENGLLVPAGNEKALADAMLSILENDPLRDSLGKAARRTAEGFRPERIFLQWAAYVDSILGENGGAP